MFYFELVKFKIEVHSPGSGKVRGGKGDLPSSGTVHMLVIIRYISGANIKTSPTS